MAYSWLDINGYDLDSFCGWYYFINRYSLEDALDGLDCWWHAPPWSEVPHWFVLDLGMQYNITEVRGRSFSNIITRPLNDYGDPIDVDVYVSMDGIEWGFPVATWIDTWQDSDYWDYVSTYPKTGRYILVYVWAVENGAHDDMIRWGGEYDDYWGYGDYFTIFDAFGELVPYIVNIVGQADASCDAYGAPTVTEKVIPLAGTCTAQTFITGELDFKDIPLEGTCTAQALITGELDFVVMDLFCNIEAIATLTGELIGIAPLLGGLTSGNLTVSGTLIVELTGEPTIFLAGVITGQSSVSGAMGKTEDMAGTITGHSSASGHLRRLIGLASKTTSLTLMEYCNEGDAAGSAIYTPVTPPWAIEGQSFVIGTNGPNAEQNISAIKLKGYRFGLPGTVTVTIKALDEDDYPTGPVLSTGTFNGNDSPESTIPPYPDPVWTALIPMTPCTFLPGTGYGFYLEAFDGNLQNWWGMRWTRIGYGPPYTSGRMIGRSSEIWGGIWHEHVDDDAMFEIWCFAAIIAKSTVSGSLRSITGVLRLTGTIACQSTTSGALGGMLRGFTGSIACQSTTSGALEHGRNLSGTISCQSSVSGALAGLTHSYTVTVAAASSVTGRMMPIKGLASTITCSSSCTGDLTTRTPIAGTVTSNLDVTGILKATRRLSATLASLCTTSGELTIERLVFLVGEISSNSGTIGILKVTWKLTGIISLESTLSGLIATTRKFTGTIAPQSTASGSMERERHLAGTIASVSTLTGVYLSLTKTIVGASSSTSTVIGTLITAGELQATIASQSTTSGLIKVNRRFSGTITAVSSTNGVVHYRVPRFVIADAFVSPILVCTIFVSSTLESTENNQPVLAHAVRASPIFASTVDSLPVFTHSTRINEELKLPASVS